MKTTKSAAALAAALLISAAGAASAAAVDVSYVVSGSAGNWTLDFDVANNMSGTSQDLYFFGVAVGGGSVAGAPAGYSFWGGSWTNSYYGGSSTVYNDTWLNSSFNGLKPGMNLDGFIVHSTDVAAPTSVDWYAFGYDPIHGSTYSGGGNFNGGSNPGFEGVAVPSAGVVPEPTNVALLLAGLGLFGVMAKRRASV